MHIPNSVNAYMERRVVLTKCIDTYTIHSLERLNVTIGVANTTNGKLYFYLHYEQEDQALGNLRVFSYRYSS